MIYWPAAIIAPLVGWAWAKLWCMYVDRRVKIAKEERTASDCMQQWKILNLEPGCRWRNVAGQVYTITKQNDYIPATLLDMRRESDGEVVTIMQYQLFLNYMPEDAWYVWNLTKW